MSMPRKILITCGIVVAVLAVELFLFAIHDFFVSSAAVVTADPNSANMTGLNQAAGSWPFYLLFIVPIIGVVAIIVTFRTPEK